MNEEKLKEEKDKKVDKLDPVANASQDSSKNELNQVGSKFSFKHDDELEGAKAIVKENEDPKKDTIAETKLDKEEEEKKEDKKETQKKDSKESKKKKKKKDKKEKKDKKKSKKNKKEKKYVLDNSDNPSNKDIN